MLNKAELSPLHKKWHKRVEGQIRDTIHSHPEWFQGDIERMTNSLAKRIVGEIIADYYLANNTESGDAQLLDSVKPEPDHKMGEYNNGVAITAPLFIAQEQELYITGHEGHEVTFNNYDQENEKIRQQRVDDFAKRLSVEKADKPYAIAWYGYDIYDLLNAVFDKLEQKA